MAHQFHERDSQVAPPVRSGEAAWTAEHPMDGSWNIICNGWAFATLHYDYRYTCNAETHYRANLIAAAPDMLAALKSIQKWLMFPKEMDDGKALWNSDFVKANNLTVAAIAKATMTAPQSAWSQPSRETGAAS